MTYIFWQPALDILHSAFLRNLAEIHSVILVSEIKMNKMRIKHGFYIPDFGKVRVLVAPDSKQINDLLEEKEAIHIFSGIRAFKMPSEVFKLAVKRKLFIGVFSEPFNWMGIKGKLRFLKYLILRIKYDKHIRFILTTGKRGRWCFETVGFKKTIIYDWAYFTETPDISIPKNKTDDLKILFIGSIDKRKNILSLISVCKNLNIIDRLQIIGAGPLENELVQTINTTKCSYLGRVHNREVAQIIVNADVLVLPSIYDGWGAVVNEALMCGVPVIASDNCGSSVLLHGIRGRVFSIKKNNLEDVLREFIEELPYDTDKREEIKNWALQNISGEAAAQYFIEIMNFINNQTPQRPVAPWLIRTL
ncbi:MAG: glycosyltransferase family 4 protein [Prevotellaceae bacterium]|jgi:glycosyltransferase involved in cell wall biosynthesis|nr:glycosyltransferase family 4 protein [Prevotellaceae bacterium]